MSTAADFLTTGTCCFKAPFGRRHVVLGEVQLLAGWRSSQVGLTV
ncbi:MAG: hypothetical protein U1F87_11645 [Kiritimatiellia bacterium]